MKCIYHNDMDGRCAGAVVAHYTGNRNAEDYIEADYRFFPIDKIGFGEEVFIVDYSFTVRTAYILAELQKRQCRIVWIDHHKSSIQLEGAYSYEWVQHIEGIRDYNASGAALTYSWFKQDSELPQFIQYVDDYDRWIYRLGDNTIYFKLGLETKDFDALDPIWDSLFNDPDVLSDIITTGTTIKQYIDNDNRLYIENFGYESTICGHKCFVVNKKTNSWIFGDRVNEYPICVVWAYDGYRYRYSIYSKHPDIDCSTIAELYGGGGHKGAAGFSSDTLLF